jgi:hypothetical protein
LVAYLTDKISTRVVATHARRGPGISMASKITSLAKPNQILVRRSIYEIFIDDTRLRNGFAILKIPNKWNYTVKSVGNMNELYSYDHSES